MHFNIKKITSVGLILVTSLVISHNTVNAQSFGDLVNSVKKLDELTKKNAEPKPEEQQQQNTSRRGMSPQDIVAEENVATYNKDENSAHCIRSVSRMPNGIDEVCLPATELRSGRDYTVKGMTSPTVDALKASSCIMTSYPTVGNMEYSFTADCVSPDDVEYTISINTAAHLFQVQSFSTAICGPKNAALDGDFVTRLMERYGEYSDTSRRGMTWDDAEHETLKVESMRKESRSPLSGGPAPSHDKCFTDTGAAWLFVIAPHRRNQWTDAMREYVASQQTQADDF